MWCVVRSNVHLFDHIKQAFSRYIMYKIVTTQIRLVFQLYLWKLNAEWEGLISIKVVPADLRPYRGLLG